MLGLFFKDNDRIKLLGKALSISALNQAVSSGTNFLYGLYLIRVLSPTEFGLYGIGFAISLFYAGIGNALLLTQMVVHAPDKESNERLEYGTRIFILINIFSLTTVFLVVILIEAMPNLFSEYSGYTYAVTAASVSFLLKEFFVRHAYNRHKEVEALLIHTVLGVTLGILILSNYIIQLQITVVLVILGYALAHIMAIIIGFIIARLPYRHVRKEQLVEDLKECWAGGRWAFITNVVYFLRTHAHTIIVTASVGPIGVAYLNAARLLITPAVMLTPALGQVFMPRLAETRVTHPSRVMPMAWALTGILLGVAISYSIVLLLSFDSIALLLLGNKYADSVFWFTVAWCVIACLLALRNGAEMTAQILKKFNLLMVANTISAIVALLAVYSFVKLIGTAGALVGLAVGETCLIILVWMVLMHKS